MNKFKDKSVFDLNTEDLKTLSNDFKNIGSLGEAKEYVNTLKKIVSSYSPEYCITKENYIKRRDNLDLLDFDSTFRSLSVLVIVSPIKILEHRPDLDKKIILQSLDFGKMSPDDYAYSIRSKEFEIRQKAKENLINYLDKTSKYTDKNFGITFTL